MQLYVFSPSPNSLCCQAVANQLGIELELISVDLASGAQMSDEFVALNPNHKIPTLVDGDFVLWESSAIMIYLCHKKPGSSIIPEDLQERVKTVQWISWNTAHWGPTCGIFTFENRVKKILNIGDPDPAQLARGQGEFARFGKVLNDHLKGRDTLVGSSVTLADHAVASWLVHAEGAGLPVEDYAEITRWSGGILGTAAWQKALATIPGA